jgi:hypothetical protein
MQRTRVATYWIFVALVFLFLRPDPAQAGNNPPQGFRDFAWGVAPDQRLRPEPVTNMGGVAVYLLPPDKSHGKLFGTPGGIFGGVPVADEAYSFANGKFASGSAWVDGEDNYERVRKSLEKRYGAPFGKAKHYDRDRIADEKRSLTVWRWADSPVEIRLVYIKQHSRTAITFLNRDLLPVRSAGASSSADAENAQQAETAAAPANP